MAKIIWDYHHLNHKLEKADCILVLGSYDTSVAERGSEIYLAGWAPMIIFSGGRSNTAIKLWNCSEADKFKQIALGMGVPEDKILVENESLNTGENVLFTKKLLESLNQNPQKFILVQKPYMERRTYATFRKLWPDKDCIVTSPQFSFAEYMARYKNGYAGKSEPDIINGIVGDFQRIKTYPEKGFQIPQEIPLEVWEAYEKLVAAGYTKQLVK